MRQYSVKALAYLGDAVYELCVREYLVSEENRSVNEYNRMAKKLVSAKNQSGFYHAIFDSLTGEEQTVMKRGRNLHPATRAKNAELSEYRHATGLETLFGFLYMEGRSERIKEVFNICVKAM